MPRLWRGISAERSRRRWGFGLDVTGSDSYGALARFGSALAFVGLAMALRGLVDSVLPGIGMFALVLPAVVLAGAICGPKPAAVAAAAAVFAMLPPRNFASGIAWDGVGSSWTQVVLFVPACLCIIWVTSVLRRAVAQARQAEARLAAVFRQIPGAAAIIAAPDGKLLMRSSSSTQILGHTEDKFDSTADLSRYEAYHGDGRPYAPEDYPISRALKRGEVVGAERLTYRQPHGHDVQLDIYAGPVRDAEGRIVAAVGMAFDVTERAEVERLLAESEREHRALSQRLQTALDAGALGMWDFDPHSGLHRWDARMAAMFGLPAEAVTLREDEVGRFITCDERRRIGDLFEAAVRSGCIATVEVRAKTVGGDPRRFVVRGMQGSETTRVSGVVRDVTEDRRREEALRDALLAREVLFREADHRIKNSLQLVVSLLGLQRRRMTETDAVQALADAIARVNAVADAHLALQQSPDLRSIALDRMLRDLCTRLNKLDPDVIIACDTPDGIVLDAEQAIPLGLLTSELVTNALRHAFADADRGTITVRVGRDGDSLLVEVADDGRGLPGEAKGAGLGTTIVKALATRLEAKLETTSVAGRGLSVSLRFQPKTRPDEEPTIPPA